jgi:hypothetical protein
MNTRLLPQTAVIIAFAASLGINVLQGMRIATLQDQLDSLHARGELTPGTP